MKCSDGDIMRACSSSLLRGSHVSPFTDISLSLMSIGNCVTLASTPFYFPDYAQHIQAHWCLRRSVRLVDPKSSRTHGRCCMIPRRPFVSSPNPVDSRSAVWLTRLHCDARQARYNVAWLIRIASCYVWEHSSQVYIITTYQTETPTDERMEYMAQRSKAWINWKPVLVMACSNKSSAAAYSDYIDLASWFLLAL
jgi:hypothetical protein